MTKLSFKILSILSFLAYAQNFSLKVIIEDVENFKGTILLPLHNSKESFPSGDVEPIQTGEIKPFDSTVEFLFSNLKMVIMQFLFFKF